MIASNRRIFLAIFLSLVVFFGIKHLYTHPQILRPENIYASIIQKTKEIKTKISSIKFPDFSKIFTLNFNPTNNETPLRPSGFEGQAINFNLPTVIQPTTSNQQQPTIANRQPTTKYYPSPYNKPSPTRRPTAVPRPPTAVPRPTAVPIPAPVPITSDTRPGTTLEEIFKEVNKRICVPAALLRAFQEEETGPWFHYYDNPVPYNTYGWWKTSAADPCKGFGYDTKTGYVPSDSYYAGRFCMITPGATPGIMGLFAINQWEQDTTRKNTVEFLPNNIDRRVIFDAAIIFASATINRVVEPECGEVWSDDVVNTAAAKHVSGQYPCTNTTCEQYSNDILSLYKKYR